jgi:hypothetical protein
MKKESSIFERNEKDSCRNPFGGVQIEGTAKGMHSLEEMDHCKVLYSIYRITNVLYSICVIMT